jgi:hypothetical protein
MQIQIISTSVETKPTAKGSYQQLEVVFKNKTFQDKVESKKLMSFGANAASFKTLADAPAGSVYDVTVVKNAQGYNDWPEVVQSTGAAPTAAATPSKASPPVKSTYETPEERAQRQILIVRQSSVSSAVAALSAGAKAPVKLEDVTTYAQALSDFVFQVNQAPQFPDVPDFAHVE